MEIPPGGLPLDAMNRLITRKPKRLAVILVQVVLYTLGAAWLGLLVRLFRWGAGL